MCNSKTLFVALSALVATSLVTAQTPPQAISYQALVRDGAGAALRNQAVSVRVRLHQDSANAIVAYAETFAPTTNGFGNINLGLGRGTAILGTFAALDWSRPMFIEIGVDPNGGSAYVDLGTTQLLSVPYAMYSGRSGTATSANLSEIRDADGNTRVSTERNADENIIRFDLSGAEKMRLRGNTLEFPDAGNSVYVGDSAGGNVTAGIHNNVFVGNRAGQLNTTGLQNTFIGNAAGRSTTTGSDNSFLGSTAGYSNTTGRQNVFAGLRSGFANTSGSHNSFLGSQAGYLNTTGDHNTFVGNDAGTVNTTGYQNTFTGSSAGISNSTGYSNTFTGYGAGNLNVDGYANAFIGASSGQTNGAGAFNTFLGTASGRANTTGSYNTFTGGSSGVLNISGMNNAFLGYRSGANNTTGSYNTLVGVNAGVSNSTGFNNTMLGTDAGASVTTGFGNVMIGYYAGKNGNDSNKLYIANSQTATPLIFGDFLLGRVVVNGTLTSTSDMYAPAFVVSSDRRLKEKIVPLSDALGAINKINGVYYDYKVKAPDGKPYPKGRQIGVIAQDVEKVYPELVVTQIGGYMAVDYPKLTAVLIEAVKELKRENEELKTNHAARLDRIEAALRLSQSERTAAKVTKR